MAILIWIGIIIIVVGVGLFIGKYLSDKKNADKIAIKTEEDMLREKMINEARKEALQDIKPELVDKLKQDELKKFDEKLSGKDKDRFAGLRKLADAMSSGANKLDTTNKLNQMLGKNTNQNNNNNPNNNHNYNNINYDPGFDGNQNPQGYRFKPKRRVIIEQDEEVEYVPMEKMKKVNKIVRNDSKYYDDMEEKLNKIIKG
jgi:uncharacterized protein YneF (UPF0154 family)